ncbi:TetR family transcriptional regulator [Nocardioides mangrovi]|uniref:TetR family transcriptional regulator n=1 Tax=Nocardioides mangrovi TaxID=2874580 RepID=A0ABS7U885_9ACTN|nr:TetR family transcriptional regulator [Nocardioides mangrovi]MBZ5737193.1 TetR family transcriptional regulator [Nocardioides mangrovi]
MAALTRERILQTAVRLADRDGPDAVTLRKIAAELGVHVTSLYNHVPTREAVTDGIVELLLDEAKLPTGPVPWDEWVRRYVEGIGEIAATHPGAFHALGQRPVQGARAAASFEIALAAFAEAGFSAADGFAALKAASYLALMIGMERSMVARGQVLETQLDALPEESFPMVRSVAADVSDYEYVWSFGVETLVAGLRAQLGPK